MNATQTKPAKPNDLPIRLLGGALFVIPFALFAWLGGWWFFGLMLAATGLATFELIGLMRKAGHAPSLLIALFAALIAFDAVVLPGSSILLFAGVIGLMATLALELRKPLDQASSDWALAVAGGLYLGLTGGHLAAVRWVENGLWWLALTCITTWLADSGAYLVGRRFGKRKLAPRISPGKTVEGYLGGIVAAVLGGALLGWFAPFGVWIWAGRRRVGWLAQLVLGDLIESMFKRQANAKDSGHLIPGHGGIYDRIDSLLWAGVLIYHLHALSLLLI
ncbi:MAG: phosphatidate cytidylyltransferase [Anaerolineae bacterium]|nr:phosphatidate cytidylyltransferase [Anaerolineae bacterium]